MRRVRSETESKSDESTRDETAIQLPEGLGFEEANALYQEASRVMFYFSEWRYKILTYFLAFAAALAAAAEWLDQHHMSTARPGHPSHPDSRIAAIPLFAGFAASVLLVVMDLRNGILLRYAFDQGAAIEKHWKVAYGFYDKIGALQPNAYRRHVGNRGFPGFQRWTSYNVTVRIWLVVSAAAFLSGSIYILTTR
jgi:hypothetical protein